FVPKGLYTPADKAALSQAINKIYTGCDGVSLPAFYVVVLFIELEPGGGDATERTIRIGIEHLAHHFVDLYEAAIAPLTHARGIHWEVQVSDCDVRPFFLIC
ncbi:hypothetical protein C8R47DRAFT_979016, partial [Mycena vitilis]